MRLDLIKKSAGEWCSFNEACGIGDGVTTEFLTPIPAAEARAVLVMRDFAMTTPDAQLDEKNELTGVVTHTPDGYKLDTRTSKGFITEGDPASVAEAMRNPPGELWIVFERPPTFGTRVSVSGLGRKIGDAFRVLPMSTVLQRQIEEKQPASLRKRDPKAVSLSDLQDAGRISFTFLVTEWFGIEGEAGPLECNAENKKAFLDQKDAMFFGLFVSNRSSAIRAEGINSFSNDSKNS